MTACKPITSTKTLFHILRFRVDMNLGGLFSPAQEETVSCPRLTGDVSWTRVGHGPPPRHMEQLHTRWGAEPPGPPWAPNLEGSSEAESVGDDLQACLHLVWGLLRSSPAESSVSVSLFSHPFRRPIRASSWH